MRHANHVVLPTIITGPGPYVTRCGETVTVSHVDRHPRSSLDRGPYAAHGSYHGQVAESWDVSGRLYPNVMSGNDIVRLASGESGSQAAS